MTYNANNQKDYEKRLSEEDKLKRRKLKQFSAAKSFIRLHATAEQLAEIKQLVLETEQANDR